MKDVKINKHFFDDFHAFVPYKLFNRSSDYWSLTSKLHDKINIIKRLPKNKQNEKDFIIRTTS